ncbi:MAG: T9SS type A sorting domain-containing protein [Saprospiraceae bacterium]|nr:T9SS type A sorting domain-containing protein [Saprospiraceae bacterium]
MRQTLLLFFFLSTVVIVAAQPANDNCADATPISEVTDLAFTTVDANTDGPFHPNSPCPGNSDMDSLYNDIWYLYTPTFTGNAFWTLCGTADFDTKIAVYLPNAPCPPADGDLFVCNEDAGSCALSTSELVFSVTKGESYLLRLAGFGDSSPGMEGTGTFSISEFVPAVANDFCSDAIPISVGKDQEINTVGATTDGPEHPNNPCFQFGDNSVLADVWYTFTPDFTGSVEWSTCNTASFDTRLAVYNANVTCPVSDADLLACNDDGSGCSAYSSLVFFEVEEGNTYLLRLGGYQGETGTGTMDLTNTSPPDPPANNLCKNAEVVQVQDPDATDGYEGTTVSATFDFETFVFPTCLSNQGGGEFAEVWYRFNSAGYQELEITFGLTTPGSAVFVDIWNDCGSGPVDTNVVVSSCFAVDEGDLLVDTFGVLQGGAADYIMRVVTRLTGDLPGDYFFQLKSVGDPSAVNVLPDAFNSLQVNPNPVSQFAYVRAELNTAEDVIYEVYDVAGVRHVSTPSLHLTPGANVYPIDTRGLQSGVYLLRMTTAAGQYTMRFFKG